MSVAVLLDDVAIAFADARLYALTIAVAALPGRPPKSWAQDTFSTELIEAFLAGGRHRIGDTSPTLTMRVRQRADEYLETRVRALQARIMLLPAAASDSDRWARDALKGELRDAFAAGALQATALMRDRGGIV